MITTQRPTLHRAVSLLAGVCDGATSRDGDGYNGADTALGHRLAEKPEDRWSPQERRKAWEMLAKYHKQLSGFGLEYGELPEPVDPANLSLMTAKFGGKCPRCGKTWAPGTTIAWDSASRSRHHVDCAAPEPTAARPAPGPATPQPGPLPDRPTSNTRPASSPPSRVASLLPADQLAAVQGSRAILGPGGVIAQQLANYEAREPQLQMADLVDRAIAGNRHAVIEAGTGTGKSLGYLVPAILSGKKTLVSTADKALQEQIWRKDAPFLQSVLPKPFTAALLKGRGNYLCKLQLSRLEEQLGQESMFEGGAFKSREAVECWPELAKWADTTEDGDLENLGRIVPVDLRELVTMDSEGCTGQKCPFYTSCFSEKAKAAAKKADVTIVNHALLLRDLAVRDATEGFASVLPYVDLVVLDEAHHLEAIATDALGLELTYAAWVRLERQVRKLTEPRAGSGDAEAALQKAESWGLRLDTVTNAMLDLFGAFEVRLQAAADAAPKGAGALMIGDDQATFAAAIAALVELEQAMGEGKPPFEKPEDEALWDKARQRVDRLAEQLGRICIPGERADEVVRYAELSGSGRAVLCLKYIDVSGELRRLLWNASLRRRKRSDDDDMSDDESEDKRTPVTVVCTSATIGTADGCGHWRARVGLDEASELMVGSPFDYRRNAGLYLVEPAEQFDPTRFYREGESEYFDRLADQCAALVEASPGGAFLLFTSNRALGQVYQRLQGRLGQRLVLRQGEDTRPVLVQRFKDDGRAVLFGVKSFWEGVDVQGAALSLVVIDKLPFVPPGDPINDARCRLVDKRAGRNMAWFGELALPDATIQIKQGFGRLIRTAADRGVVALLDGRLTCKPYGARIVKSLPPARQLRSLDEVRALFGAGR
jgi:ATP-dependent DNA helicase DinG